MYNADKPSYSDLPTSKQLIRSTIIAIISAAVMSTAEQKGTGVAA